MKPFLVMMHGLTGVGKSKLAIDIAEKTRNTEILHSAKIRTELQLTPEDLEPEIGEKYQLRLDDKNFVNRVSPVVYKELLVRAKSYLATNKNVILDASYCLKWEREQVYDFVNQRKISYIIIHCLCSDEKEIKRRIAKRNSNLIDPLNEASAWETYLSLKSNSDPIEGDLDSENLHPKRVIVDNYKKNIKLLNFNEDQLALTNFAYLVSTIKTIIRNDCFVTSQ